MTTCNEVDIIKYARKIYVSEIHPELKEGSAASVGMEQEGLERAGDVLESAIIDEQIRAASLVVARDATIVFAQGYGCLSPKADAPAVEPDSVFLLASITKPVTACALMLLVDRGLVALDDPVSCYLPEFQGGERDKVRVCDLLSHTSGMPDMLPQHMELRRAHAPLSEFVRLALKTPLLYSPGTNFSYLSKGVLLAAEIVERITGQRLRDFKKEEIFDPLEMSRSALGLGRFEISETVWCGMAQNESRDRMHFGPNSAYWRNTGCPWGGMHSTGPELAILLQTMLNHGEYAGRRIFSAASVRAMTVNQHKAPNGPWGLGWALSDSWVWNFFGELVSASTFGHVGATGTVAWADPERQLLCVVLTNQMLGEGSLLRRVSNAVSAAVIS